jgi:hypothetical protein
MRKLLLFVAAIAVLGVAGVAGAAKPAAVTISLAKPVVVYGNTVKLSGKVGNHQAGEQVIVLGKAYGQPAFTPVQNVATTAHGAWSYEASPQIATAYEAQWGTATSSKVTVKVRPKIMLALVSRTARKGTFSVQVDGARSFEGKRVLVQRLTPSGPTTVKRVVLDSNSSATFTLRLPKTRSRVRILMPVSQTAPGYLAGYSNVWKSS